MMGRLVPKDVHESGVGQDETVFKDIAKFTRRKARVNESCSTKRRPFHLNVFKGRVADVGMCKGALEKVCVV